MNVKSALRRAGLVTLSATILALSVSSAFACTAMMVGKKASTDGSTMVTHTCDGWYDARLRIIPGEKFEKGAMVPVYKNWCYQTMPTKPLRKVGEIPQVSETYTYFNVGYPFMNEHKLTIGEATWGGREESFCDAGWLLIGQLEAFGLQRAKTAREVIKVMGDLAEKYGYGDSGEGLCIADGDEVWLFEICGPGPLWAPGSDKLGAVWAAQRVPDDQVSAIANRSRIGEINFNDPDNFMYSSNVKSFAKDMGWWKSGTKFVFHDAYAPKADNAFCAGCSRREWRVLDTLAPSLKLVSTEAQYPFSVKPDKKVSPRDLIAINRDHYQGTKYDLSKTIAGGPFECPVLYRPTTDQRPEGLKGVHWERTISIFRCSYSHVAQSWADLPDPVGAVLWFGEDMPATTCYVPVFSGTTKVPASWAEGKRNEFDRDSAWWAFNFVGNWATLKWNYMVKDINAEQESFEDVFFMEQPVVRKEALKLYKESPAKAVAYVTDYTCNNMKKVEKAWWTLGEKLVGKYCDGYVMTDEGKQENAGYPTWWLEKVGYGETSNSANPR